MVGWHHHLNEYEFEQTTKDGKGQKSLVWCSTLDCKELNMTELWNSNRKRSNEKSFTEIQE